MRLAKQQMLGGLAAFVVAVISIAVVGFSIHFGIKWIGEPKHIPTSTLGKYEKAAVASEAPGCSTVGVEMMKKHGGSTVDAAIAAMICVGVVNLHSAGVGGGHIMVIYDTPRGKMKKEINTIMARETAPLLAHQNMFVNATDSSSKGGLSIAVPGEVQGFYEAWSRYGRVPWRKLWEPSITLCEEGHVISPNLARYIHEEESTIRKLLPLRSLLVKANNQTYKEGEYIKRPLLAKTLRRIAEDPHTFHNGSLAEDVIADLEEQGAIITMEDLRNFRPAVKKAISSNISANHVIYSPPAPSGGPILNYILNILRGYNFGPDDVTTTAKTVVTYHRIVEAFKHAYAKRSVMGDEDFIDIQQEVEMMMSTEFGESIRSLIPDNMTLPDVQAYNPGELTEIRQQGTAHLSVLGADGSAVSVTSSINTVFGSKIRGTRTGVIFNNHMADFSIPGKGFPSGPSNYIAPGKRPRSSMSPAIVLDREGRVVLVSGASGGSRIITSAAFVAMQALWFRRPLVTAVDTPRLYHPLFPNKVFYEKGFPEEILAGLREKGHEVKEYVIHIGVVFPILNRCRQCENSCHNEQCIHAVTDRRKPSYPDGY